MSVFYKFKAWREPATIPVDSTGISVWDLKKEIIQANNLAPQAKEFDLHLYNSQSNEEFRNDHTIVPRSTTIIAQRLPAKKPHKGTAQHYVVETVSSNTPITANQTQQPQKAEYRGRMSMRFDRPAEQPNMPGLSDPSGHSSTDVNQDEAARIDAMFEQSDQQWEQTQSEMAMRKRVPYSRAGGGGSRPNNSQAPSKPPPTGYVCYRCGQPGHWIQECPTNDDPNFENRPRAKRTTGIPRSFLQTVAEPAEGQSGLMIGTDGGYVIARPDAASWAQHRAAVPKNLSASDVQALQPEDPDLQCSIDSRLLREAVKVPCCSTSFCQECITKYLQAHSYVCPECESKIKSLAQLKADEDRRTRVSEYIEEMVQASRETKEREKQENGEGDDEKASGDESKSKNDDEGQSKKRSESPSEPRGDNKDAGDDESKEEGHSDPGNPAVMNGMMLQMQMQQCMMMMSNPMLPPPARMQLGMQLQQLQMMFMMQQQQQQQQQQGNNEQQADMPSKDTSTARPSDANDSSAQGRLGKRRADSEESQDAKRSRAS